MQTLTEALKFPFKKANMRMFLCLIGLYALHYFIFWLPVVSIVGVLFLGYIYATQFKIIFTTGNGYEDAPDFPDFGGLFDSVLVPLLKMAFIWIIAFIPYVLVAATFELSDMMDLLFLLTGFLYVPIGLMITAMDDYPNALNPMTILQGIRSSGGLYVVMVVAFIVMTFTTAFIDEQFPGSWILGSLIGAYSVMFTGRLVGAVYRERLADDFSDLLDSDESFTE